MNHFDCRAEWKDGAWRAMVRYVHHSSYWPVMDGDRMRSYDSEAEAKLAAHERLLVHMNTTIRREGETCTTARAEADKLFRRGKVIPVEHRRRA